MDIINSQSFAARQLTFAHHRTLDLGAKGVLMAIVNVTPDSFSDGGQFSDLEQAVAFAHMAIDNGAEIIDIGGESTRPGAVPVSEAEEQDRVLPLIERLSRETDAVISIDTYRAETARLAVAAGAHMVNDVSGGTAEPEIFDVVASTEAGYCLMHTSRGRQTFADPLEDQFAFFKPQIEAACAAGVSSQQLLLDPGFGFGKGVDENLSLMAHMEALQTLGLPVLVGTSRKRFVAALSGANDNLTRDFGTAATTVLTRLAGGSIFRVHNIPANRAALAFADAMIALRQGDN